MASYNTELLQILQEFKDGSFTIDWQAVAADNELMEGLQEDLDSLIHTAAFLTDIDHEKKANLLGSLVIQQGRIERFLKSEFDLEQWLALCTQLEDILKKLIAAGSWLGKADERYEELADFEEKFAHDQVLPEELDYFAPVLVALAIASVLHADQSEESEEHE
jgi:hypothetical protein